MRPSRPESDSRRDVQRDAEGDDGRDEWRDEPRAAPGRARRAEWAVLLLAAILWLPALPVRDLWSPDEPRIAQVAEELRAATETRGLGAAFVLELNGEPYSQKPPLYYWMSAALGSSWGHVDPWAARLPSTLAGIAGIALTMALARVLFPALGARAAPWAGLLLLLSFRWGELSQRASLDVVLSALELAALVAWLRFVRGEWTRERAWPCTHALLGLGMLVKGPVALLPLAVIGLGTAWSRRRDAVPLPETSGLWAPRNFALSIGPFLLWGGVVLASTPAGFFHDAVVDNLIGRFFSGTSHARPFYYYAAQLPLEFLPSALLLPAAFVAGRRALKSATGDAVSWRVLAVWSATFLVFFSLSAGKRGSYLLPLFPALSVAAAVGAHELFSGRSRLPFRFGAIASGIALALGGLAAAGLWSGARTSPIALGSGSGFGRSFEVPDSFLVACVAIGAAAAFAGALAIARGWSCERRSGGIAAGLVALQLAVSQLLYPALDVERSLRPIAEAASALALPEEPIGVFRHPSLKPGLAYYADGPAGRFVDLQSRGEVDAFLSEQGRVLIAEPSRNDALGEPPLPVQARFRDGERTVWVLAPSRRADRARSAGWKHAVSPGTPR